MPNKSELEESINETLGTDIEWSRMTKDDLEEFEELLDDKEFIQTVVGQYANDVTGDKVQGQIEGWEPGQGLSILAQMQSDEASLVDLFM